MNTAMALLLKIAPYGAAVSIAIVIYFVLSSITIEKSAADRVKKMTDPNAASIFERGGERLADRMGTGAFKSWKTVLEWAQINGKYTNWTSAGMLLRGSAAAVFISLLIMVFGLPVFAWLLVPMAIFAPYLMVNSAAEEARKLVTRLLPETATVIAAEMDAGGTAAQALGRAGELPGPLGNILRRAVSKARQSDRAMFSRGANKGILMEELGKLNLQELSRFANQLDRVAAKGVDAPRIMVEIAKGLAREYKSHVQQTASNMETELIMPMTLFFFLPFIVAIMLPVIVSLTLVM